MNRNTKTFNNIKVDNDDKKKKKCTLIQKYINLRKILKINLCRSIFVESNDKTRIT